MKITIGKFDKSTNQVAVIFDHEGVTFSRPVNACLTAAGAYDEMETAARCDEVARGVAAKIEMGIITNPPPTAEDNDKEETEA